MDITIVSITPINATILCNDLITVRQRLTFSNCSEIRETCKNRVKQCRGRQFKSTSPVSYAADRHRGRFSYLNLGLPHLAHFLSRVRHTSATATCSHRSAVGNLIALADAANQNIPRLASA